MQSALLRELNDYLVNTEGGVHLLSRELSLLICKLVTGGRERLGQLFCSVPHAACLASLHHLPEDCVPAAAENIAQGILMSAGKRHDWELSRISRLCAALQIGEPSSIQGLHSPGIPVSWSMYRCHHTFPAV